jgi:hypothetical protein
MSEAGPQDPPPAPTCDRLGLEYEFMSQMILCVGQLTATQSEGGG